MNDRIFYIVYSKLVQWLTPAVLRKKKLLAWLQVCTIPVVVVYTNFLRFKALKLYQLGITPQVCYLEKLLNDQYDFVERRIRIVDAEDHDPLFVFQRAELKPVNFYRRSENKPVYVYSRGESSEFKDDFIVIVPFGISFNRDEMAALVSAYKLASKSFKITQQ